MPHLKGQLDGFDYPRSIASKPHNLGMAVKKGTKFVGQMDKGMKMISRKMPSMGMNKVSMKGQMK